MSRHREGKVYLVGAGPGDAGLITIRGVEVLRAADCVIYDKLVNPSLLKFARADAEIIHTPKRTKQGSFTQERINKLLIEKASKGLTVARLKGGDPCIFGRGGQEAAILARAGIDFEIVPGVTAAIAAAGYAGIMLTDREYSSQVVFVTGRQAEGKRKSGIDWGWLGRFEGTIVLYMAMENLEFISAELMKNGMAGQMPAAVITNATLPSQRIVRTSLELLGEKCRQQAIEPPAIVIIGAAADSDASLNWFENKPLFGKNIVVTRHEDGNADFAAKIVRRGGNPIEFSTMKIKPVIRKDFFQKKLGKFEQYDWVVFTSVNGVAIFFDYLEGIGRDARIFGRAKVAAIGAETAAKLREFGLRADFVPAVYTSEELGKGLIDFVQTSKGKKARSGMGGDLGQKRILLLRSELASNELAELLKAAGAEVDEVAVYSITAKKGKSEWLKQKIAAGAVDWITFASPFSVRVFFEKVPAEVINSSDVKVASIGPVTSKQLEELGIKVDVEPAEHTIEGLLEAIEEDCRK